MTVIFSLIRDVQSGFIRRDWLENPPQQGFFCFDPEATGRNPKNHMVKTKITWFGTWLLFFYIYIYNYTYIYIYGCHNPNWRTHIFQRGRSITNRQLFRKVAKLQRHPPLKPMKMPGLSALAPWSSEMRIWVGGKKIDGNQRFWCKLSTTGSWPSENNR